MAITYGDPAATRRLEVTPADVKVSAIAAPATGARVSGNVTVTYTLESDLAVTASLDPEWSTNGSTYADCTAGPGGDGTTGLATSGAGTVHTYIWNSVTDVGSAVEDEVYVRLRANDGAAWSPYSTSSAFTVDNLPLAPALSTPADNWFAKDTTPIFAFTIPTDPGTDNFHFKCTVYNTSGTAVLTRESNTTATGWEYWDDNSADYTGKRYPAYYVQNVSVTSLTGQTITFASLTDSVRGTALPASITGARVMLQHKADRLCYVTSVTSSGFTAAKSVAGGADDGLVDILVFKDWGTGWDEYWVIGYVVSSATDVNILWSALTDVNAGSALPGTITNAKLVVMYEADRQVIVTNISNTGFTIRKAAGGGSDNAQVTLMVLKTPADAYWVTGVTETTFGGTSRTYASLTDAIAGTALPAHIPWAFLLSVSKNGTLAYISASDSFDFALCKSTAGEDTNAQVDLMIFAPDVTGGFWVPMTTDGVPDAYEGAAARYTVQAADALAQAEYDWTIVAGNLAA
jgi:hypothetical protein